MVDPIPRPLFIELYPTGILGNDVNRRLPPHRLVIEPLLAAAEEVAVHQPKGAEFGVPVPPHTIHRSVVFLDTKQELVRGWELFWNATAWLRGGICLRVRLDAVDWPELFSWTQYGGVWSSRYQILKGTPRGTVAYADRHGVGDQVVASLSASNGIQWLDLWADPARCHDLDALAQANCRHFVRWVEHGKFPREIVYDRDPYRSMI